MVRYAQRPWYTPIGFMNSSPASFMPMVAVLGFLIVWPVRYRVSEFFERQRDGPHIEARHKAVRYYQEMERMHRRQTLNNLECMQQDNSPHRVSASMSAEALRIGNTDQEFNYWYAHQRDAIRAEKLLKEVRELKSKIAAAEGSA